MKGFPFLSRFIVVVVIPIAILTYLAHQYLVSSLPQADVTLQTGDMVGKANVTRDEHGVTYISASSDEDVFYATGFAHAQDRFWQMELQRRMAQGRLSEIFGRQTVDQDIWFRTLGLYQSAGDSWGSLSVEARASLTAYSKGVNAWLAQTKQLPPEFGILGVTPQPWQVNDSMVMVKLFALTLSGNLREEIELFIAKQSLKPSYLSSLYHQYPADVLNQNAETAADNKKQALVLETILASRNLLEQTFGVGNRFTGSNALVISGNLTKSGNAILANDPHMGLQIPSLWYALNQKGKNLDSSGMSLVGLPVVILGRNASFAWGATNMMADVQDLYFEQQNPVNPTQYKDHDEWQPLSVTDETIAVKADFPDFMRAPIKPIKIQVRTSVRGPIFSDVNNLFQQMVSLSWTGLDRNDTTYESFFRINYAVDWGSFKEAVKYHIAPTLNLFYADNNNNIGFIGVGRVPLRSKGQGDLPVIGGTGEYQWQGYIPFAEWPQSYNPKKGYIVNANNDNTSADYPYFISHNFALPVRSNRIEGMIAAAVTSKGKIELDDVKAIQGDTFDLLAQELLPSLKLSNPDKRQAAALAYLADWKGDMNVHSQAATIFETWIRHLRSDLFRDKFESFWNQQAHNEIFDNIVGSRTLRDIETALNNPSPNWCDNLATNKVEDCQLILSRSLDSALDELVKLYGSNMDNWQWGKAQSTLYIHRPFSNIKLMDVIFERKIGNGGSGNSVNIAASNFVEGKGYRQGFGAAFRQIIQLSKTEPTHLYMNSTGQSGHVMSPHYDDMVESFRDVKYFELKNAKSVTQQGR